MPNTQPVRYLDRQSGQLIQEKILGEAAARWFYQTSLGSVVFRSCLRGSLASRLYGAWNDSRLSAGAIRQFIADTGLDTDEILLPLDQFKTFNEFFARQLKPDARPIDPTPEHLVSAGDGKLLVFPRLDDGLLVPVKGARVSIRQMVADDCLYGRYEHGSALVLRLAPADYHRFHFVDDGEPTAARDIPGGYDSVNPIALGSGRPIFAENRRSVSSLATDRFGLVTYVEVGALFVGGIVQSYVPDQPVRRGDEKGYFQFGGSTVVMLFEPGRVTFDADLVDAAGRGLEVAVRLGERIGLVGPSR